MIPKRQLQKEKKFGETVAEGHTNADIGRLMKLDPRRELSPPGRNRIPEWGSSAARLCSQMPFCSSRLSLDVAICQRVTQSRPSGWTPKTLPLRRQPPAPDISGRSTAIWSPSPNNATRHTSGRSNASTSIRNALKTSTGHFRA